MVVELKEYLKDYIKTCFFTNYYFEYNGQRINDFTEFKDLKITNKIHGKFLFT